MLFYDQFKYNFNLLYMPLSYGNTSFNISNSKSKQFHFIKKFLTKLLFALFQWKKLTPKEKQIDK